MATRCEYLTARCPYGCEVWLHPKAVAPHADRCRKMSPASGMGPLEGVFRQWDGTISSPVMGPPVRQ